MKRCPVCYRIYEDLTLNFCLEDGAQLLYETDSEKTLEEWQGRIEPPPTEVYPCKTEPAIKTITAPQWVTPQRPTASLREGQERSSRTWMFGVVGALALLIIAAALYAGLRLRSGAKETEVSASNANTNVNVMAALNVNGNAGTKATNINAGSSKAGDEGKKQAQPQSDNLPAPAVNSNGANTATGPKLGLEVLTDTEYTKNVLHLNEGLPILSVAPNSPAAEAGLHGMVKRKDGMYSLGDIILAVDGEKVYQADDIIRLVGKHQGGDTVQLEILSDNRRVIIPVHLRADRS